MYNSQDIAYRIKLRAKDKGYSISAVLSACDLGKNTISKISQGTDILTLNFAKIADYLDCSVDYLLGRTDIPEINKPSEDVRIFKIAARDGEKEIELTAAQRAEIARIVENSKNDDNSDLF